MMNLDCFAIVALLFTTVQGQGNGAVRLYNMGNSSITGDGFGWGIVEVYYNLKWNTVCNEGTDTYDLMVGNTICRQLGYSGGTTHPFLLFPDDPNSPGFSSVSCNDSDINLLSCNYDTTSTNCTSWNYLGVSCYPWPVLPYPGNIRLTGFTQYSGRGLIEVYCNDEWGLVCNDGFTKNDADTVCRQLGYTEAASYGKDYGSGNSSQSVWFDNPGCNSSTKCLTSCHSCPSSAIGKCSVDNVAGVTCSYNTRLSGDAGSHDYCFFAYNIIVTDGTIKGLVGIIIGAIVAFFVLVLVIVLTPIICCCWFGVGIGAKARRPHYSDI